MNNIYTKTYNLKWQDAHSVVQNMRISEGYLFRLIPYLNYLGTPLQVLLSSSYGNVRQGSNFESCVWRAVSSQSSHHPQEVLLAQFSLYVHKGGLKPDSFHFLRECNLYYMFLLLDLDL